MRDYWGAIAALATVVIALTGILQYFSIQPSRTSVIFADKPLVSEKELPVEVINKKLETLKEVIAPEDISESYEGPVEQIASDLRPENDVPSIESGSVSSLRAELELAERMFSTTGKDTSLSRIVDKAILSGELAFAKETADKIFSTTSKDASLEKISDECRRINSWTCSFEAIESIFSTRKSDRQSEMLARHCFNNGNQTCFNKALRKIFSTSKKDRLLEDLLEQ